MLNCNSSKNNNISYLLKKTSEIVTLMINKCTKTNIAIRTLRVFNIVISAITQINGFLRNNLTLPFRCPNFLQCTNVENVF